MNNPALHIMTVTAICCMLTAKMAPGETTDREIRSNDGPEQSAKETAAGSDEQDAMPRDPFWPIGFLPERPADANDTTHPEEPEEPDIEPPDWEAAREILRFQGSFRTGRRYLARVNGQIVEVGSVIGTRLPPYIYQWRIIEIGADGIETEPLKADPIE